MDIMLAKLTSGYLLSYWTESDYKLKREAFMKESEVMSRIKELLKED